MTQMVERWCRDCGYAFVTNETRDRICGECWALRYAASAGDRDLRSEAPRRRPGWSGRLCKWLG